MARRPRRHGERARASISGVIDRSPYQGPGNTISSATSIDNTFSKYHRSPADICLTDIEIAPIDFPSRPFAMNIVVGDDKIIALNSDAVMGRQGVVRLLLTRLQRKWELLWTRTTVDLNERRGYRRSSS